MELFACIHAPGNLPLAVECARGFCLPRTAVRRISLASWFRLRHAAERTGAAFVALEREINARSCPALR